MESRFISRWTSNGRVTHFIGEPTLATLAAAQKERDKDPRIESLAFVIVDFTYASPDTASVFEAHVRGREDAKTWLKNPHLQMLLVSNSEIFEHLFIAYENYMKVLNCPWKIVRFADLQAACTYANQTFAAGLSLAEWQDLPAQVAG